MKILSRSDLKSVIGGQTIQNSCGYTGQFYVWCRWNIHIAGGDDFVECWSGCVSDLTDGCSTDPNNICI